MVEDWAGLEFLIHRSIQDQWVKAGDLAVVITERRSGATILFRSLKLNWVFMGEVFMRHSIKHF